MTGLSAVIMFSPNAEHFRRNASLDELQAGIKIGSRNISHLRYADNTTLMEENKEEQRAS